MDKRYIPAFVFFISAFLVVYFLVWHSTEVHDVDLSFNFLVDEDKINTVLDKGADMEVDSMLNYYIGAISNLFIYLPIMLVCSAFVAGFSLAIWMVSMWINPRKESKK